jgi:opacity protein-like surface antigen
LINTLKAVVGLILPLLLAGCFTLPDSEPSRGVKLSDAMDSSVRGDHRDLGGSRSAYDVSSSPEAGVPITGGSGGGAEFIGASYDKNEYTWQLPADVSYAQPINSDFQGLTHFTLTPLAVEDEENFFGIYVGGAIVDLKPGSLPARAVDRTWMLETGLTFRHYFNSSRPAFSPYVTASVGYALLSWSYRNQIYAGGQAFQSDSLNAAEGSLAFGLSTRRDHHISLFGEAGIGGTAFADRTNHGFDNDVFHNFGFLTFKAGVCVRF